MSAVNEAHKALLKAAMDAINRLYSDTRVGRGVTKESLEELKEDIDMRLEMLSSDDDCTD